MSQEQDDLNFVNYMGHFLVSLGCISVSSKLNPPAVEKKFFTSGFVIELNSDWYLVSCGHVFDDIKNYIAKNPSLIHTFVIHSGMGTFAIGRELVRFKYREPDFSVNRPEGLDFGAIKLTTSERAVLSANRIIPVEQKYWDQELPKEFSAFAELGLPLQNMDLDTPGEAGFQPVFIRIEPAATIAPQYAKQTDKMRYFNVMEPSRPDLDIVGMSGCPVFAFWERPGKDMKALVCAMQSSWLRKSRIVATVDLRFACQQLRAAVAGKP
ncbi:MAG: hypothetical protein K8U57_08730 [Planctomycetes bacterium]|nr:hypothetical protein [Planctomycetota bacterium]